MGNSNSQGTTGLPTSDFYYACRSGDVETVKQILPTMRLKEINRIESNGSTALHAAAWYGHFEIVELLLKYGCSTTTINKYGKTAAQECEDERIRQLIQSSAVTLDNDEGTNDHAPKSKWCHIYENIDNQDKSVLTTKIMKLRLRTYLANRFKSSEADRIDHIRKIVLHTMDASHSEHALNYLEKFERTKNPEHLITLYTTESGFYRYIIDSQDEIFHMELLIALMVFKERFFRGVAYRGVILNKVDLDFYLWAWNHHASCIEIRTILSTSADRSVAERFMGCGDHPTDRSVAERFMRCGDHPTDKFPTLFILHFPEQFGLAIGINDISEFRHEQEIMIIPGTFFEVISVSTDHATNRTIIELKNIPVSRNILLKTINELK